MQAVAVLLLRKKKKKKEKEKKKQLKKAQLPKQENTTSYCLILCFPT